MRGRQQEGSLHLLPPLAHAVAHVRLEAETQRDHGISDTGGGGGVAGAGAGAGRVGGEGSEVQQVHFITFSR